MSKVKESISTLNLSKLQLPDVWEWARIREIGSNDKNAIVDGPFGSNLKLSDYVESGTVPVLTTKNLEGDYSTVRFISQSKFEELRRSEVKGGDILMAKIGSCGKTGIYPDHLPSAIIPANLLKVTLNSNFNRKYVYFYFNSKPFTEQLKRIIKATAQPAFGVTSFKELRIPVAPFAEQQRIVEEIEKQFTRLDAAVAALKRVQANLKRYRASVLKVACEGKLVLTEAELARAQGRDYESADKLLERILKERRAKWEADQLARMKAQDKEPKDDKWKDKYQEPAVPDISDLPELPKGWVWTTTGQLCDCIVPNRDKPKTFSGDIPWITLPDFYGRTEIRSSKSNLGLSPQEVELYKAKVIPKGSAVMSCIGRFGIAAVLSTDVVVNQQIHAFLITSLLSAKYLVNVIAVMKPFMEKIATATTIAYLNKENCNSVPVPLPPLAEQQRIVTEVERHLSVIDEIESVVKVNLKRAERLRQAILKHAFEGKLVAQDPNDEPASVLLERIRQERASLAAATKKKEPADKKKSSEFNL